MQFNVTISSDAAKSPNAGQLTDGERQEILDTMKAATTMWSWYLTASDVTLDMEIDIDNSDYSGNTLAEGGPHGYFRSKTDFQGATVWFPDAVVELHNGQDFNAGVTDLFMTLTVDAIRNQLYFKPDVGASLTPYTVPFNKYDALSVFLHEVGHGLGIDSLSDSVSDPTFATDKTPYDLYIDSNSRFNGPNALAAVAGRTIQLDPKSLAHFSESGSFASDLMSTTVPEGTRVRISALDVGVLQDLSVPIRAATSGDDILHVLSSAALVLGAGNDTAYVDYHSLSVDGGSGVDTVAFSAGRSGYVLTQTGVGNFNITGPDGTDTLTNVEYAQFADQTVRLLPGSGTAVDFSAPPATYMTAIRDFDGNDLGAPGGWVLIGSTDVNHSANQSHIYVNSANGRWAEVGTAPDGLVYFNDYSWAGVTRVVGIYVDPLVQSGQVTAGSDNDSQRRFQNDLQIGNIGDILGSGDYDGDGFQEIYFRLTDGTAYLHTYMWGDGNIRYANYQSAQQVKEYLAGKGYGPSTWGSWFLASDTMASAPEGLMMASSGWTAFNAPDQVAPTLAGAAI